MADQPPRSGQGGTDPPPRWPTAPGTGSEGGGGARPPSAPPPGWAGTAPSWAQPNPEGSSAPGGGSGAGPGGGGPLAALRTRKGMAIAGAAVLLLVMAVVGVVVLGGGGGGAGSGGDGGSSGGGGSKSSAPAASAGKELSLLDGRLIVVAPEGWEQREASADAATVKVELRLPGRDLLGTLVTTAAPPRGDLEGLLTGPESTRFEVDTKGAGVLQASVLPASGNVRAGVLRPTVTVFVSLSVFALDGQPLDGPVLQKLFTDQIAPQLRIP